VHVYVLRGDSDAQSHCCKLPSGEATGVVSLQR
jgi:hypothetical protein